MRFENAFAVQAPIDEVWAALLDVERVAPCMPGAEVLERVGDDAYKVGIKVKVGPISMTYKGQVQIVDRDEQAHTATMQAKAREARGQGTADAHVHMSLASSAEGTNATMDTEVQLSGKVAAMGQGVISDVSAKLVQTFAANLAEMLAPTAAAETAAEVAAGATTNGAVAAAGPAATADGGAGGPAAEAPGGSGAPTAQPSPAEAEPPAAGPAAATTGGAPPRAAPAQSSLPVGEIAATVIAGRLSNPRVLFVTILGLLALGLGVGYRVGRSR